MLLCPDHGRRTVGQRQTETVGAGLSLGVGEPGRKVDSVEGAKQCVVPAEPVEDEPLRIGEHQADRLRSEALVQPAQDLLTALEEERLVVVASREDRFDRLQGDAVVLAALPGGQESTWQPLGALGPLCPTRQVLDHGDLPVTDVTPESHERDLTDAQIDTRVGLTLRRLDLLRHPRADRTLMAL